MNFYFFVFLILLRVVITVSADIKVPHYSTDSIDHGLRSRLNCEVRSENRTGGSHHFFSLGYVFVNYKTPGYAVQL
jgi:hypothetical protein